MQQRKAPSGKYYPHTQPGPKSCEKLREAIRKETAYSTQWKKPEKVFGKVNQKVRGWIGYFHYANSTQVFNDMQRFTQERMRRWLWKKHGKTNSQYSQHYCNEKLHNDYGLIKFPLYATWKSS